MPMRYNEPAGMHKKGTITIGVMLARGIKSHRDKLSGILRYAATKPHWTIAILDDAKSKNAVLDAVV